MRALRTYQKDVTCQKASFGEREGNITVQYRHGHDRQRPLSARATIGSVDLQRPRRLASAQEITPRSSLTEACVRFALTETALQPQDLALGEREGDAT